MTAPLPLTVMTVTWNGWHDTRRLLQSLAEADLPAHEILVFDNNSQDGTPDHIARLFPSVTVIRNTENLGHTRAVNQGLKLAAGANILLLDSDTEVAPDAARLMLDHLAQHATVGIVAPRTFNTDGTVQQSARRFPSPINGLFGRQSVLSRWFPANPYTRRYLQSDMLSATEPFAVENVSGACMLFRRELAQSVGPWDEAYFAYWVDTDWCFRALQAGWRIVCVPAASVIHHEQNRKGKKKSLRRIWIFHYGAYRFYRKTRTWGMFDPRAIAAMLALSVRALFQIAQDPFLPAAAPAPPKKDRA